MAYLQLILDNITFTYPSSPNPVFSEVTAHFASGWTGVVGANGSGKSTLLKIAVGELSPQAGTVSSRGKSLYCPQRTDAPPPLMPDFMNALDADACKLRGRLDMEHDWHKRWDTLSHGERKRAQIATALWQKPDVFLVDEPTNHIDADTRHMLLSALSSFDGAGIIVTHDRTILDRLCYQCLFLEDIPVMRPGGYSQGLEEHSIERQAMHRKRQHAVTKVKKLKREMASRKHEASAADRKRSKRGLSRKDHDARLKMDVARVTGKDGAAGRRLKQLSGRYAHAEQELLDARVTKEHTTGIWVPGACSRRDVLFSLPAANIPLGENRHLHIPSLSMQPADRIGLTGPNGTGKSTLVGMIIRELTLPPEKLISIPQEISAPESAALLREVKKLTGEKLGRIMQIVSHLNSRPERLLESTVPSPGEIRKLMLALGIMREPHLIILDEPTNHLDLPSIECLEDALRDCPCGLLLVSHDLRFIENTTNDRWHITLHGNIAELATLHSPVAD